MKKLELDLKQKKLEKELESVEHKSIGENVCKMNKTLDERQNLQHDGEDIQCCWNGACLFVGMPGPPLDECGHSDCISREKFHHACMVNWVEQRDPNPECLKLCCDCCVKKYKN